MTTKMTIGFVRRGYSQSGGAEAYLKRLARGVVELGHEANLFATTDWPLEQWPFGSITHIAARAPIAFADEVEKLRASDRSHVLMSLERIWNCDVYRAGDGVHRAWLARRRKFELPLKRFVGGFNRTHRHILQLEQALFANGGADRVIANSEMVKKEIVDLYGYPAEKVDIIRNGVPLEQFRFYPELRETSREQLKFRPDQIVLLFAGSGWERKGLQFAVAAMALCRNRKMRLLVAGRGNQRYYKSKHVRFLGEAADLLPMYAAADIFILPTIYDPSSNACLEALACGLPVITTRDNGFSEIVEHGVHGSVLDSASNLVMLHDAIQFWSDSERRAAVRAINRQRAEQFDVSTNVAQTVQILLHAAANAASTSGKIRNI